MGPKNDSSNPTNSPLYFFECACHPYTGCPINLWKYILRELFGVKAKMKFLETEYVPLFYKDYQTIIELYDLNQNY